MDSRRYVMEDYLNDLSSKKAVPGGGGASAIAGAVGASLASMVGELTVGKKKYADVEESVKVLIAKAVHLRERFLELSDADAEAFLPLSIAYSMPRDGDEQKAARKEVMQKALIGAAGVPLRIMQCCAETVEVLEEMLNKGSALAVSDVGVGALLAKAAMESAALNVYINTKLMDDEERKIKLNSEVSGLLETYAPRADAVYQAVLERVKK